MVGLSIVGQRHEVVNLYVACESQERDHQIRANDNPHTPTKFPIVTAHREEEKCTCGSSHASRASES